MDLLTLSLVGLGSNKIFIGISMLVVNMGSRFVFQDLTKLHAKIMSHGVFKVICMACIFFTATRDIMLSIILSFIFSMIIYGLLDENRQFNLWHSSMKIDTFNQNQNQNQNYKISLYKENFKKFININNK